MVASAGETDRDLAWTQLAQKLGVYNIDPSECGRDRSGFGGDTVYKKLRRIQYYRVLNIINLK